MLLEAEDGIATITLNRPDRLNAFSDQMEGTRSPRSRPPTRATSSSRGAPARRPRPAPGTTYRGTTGPSLATGVAG